MTIALKIKEIAGCASRQNGCRVYDIYKHRDRLQILIDKKSEASSVSLTDCENVFHSLRFLLQSELPDVLNNYRLEVSSPGVERRLREKWHFEESIGETMKLIANTPLKIKNKKTGKSFSSQSLRATLAELSETALHLKNDFIEAVVPFSAIKSVHLVFKTKTIKKERKVV